MCFLTGVHTQESLKTTSLAPIPAEHIRGRKRACLELDPFPWPLQCQHRQETPQKTRAFRKLHATTQGADKKRLSFQNPGDAVLESASLHVGWPVCFLCSA
jgi:hypothetical protein